MNRTPHDAVPRWRRRLAQIVGACGLFLLNLAFVAMPVAADRHGGNDGGHHDGQGVEAEHHGSDGPGHDVNDNRGNDINDNDVNDDRVQDVDNDDVNDDRGNDPQDDVNDNRDNDDAPMMVLMPKSMSFIGGR